MSPALWIFYSFAIFAHYQNEYFFVIQHVYLLDLRTFFILWTKSIYFIFLHHLKFPMMRAAFWNLRWMYNCSFDTFRIITSSENQFLSFSSWIEFHICHAISRFVLHHKWHSDKDLFEQRITIQFSHFHRTVAWIACTRKLMIMSCTDYFQLRISNFLEFRTSQFFRRSWNKNLFSNIIIIRKLLLGVVSI